MIQESRLDSTAMALFRDLLNIGTAGALDREARILSKYNAERIRLGKSRNYLDDYGKFVTVFTLKNFILQFTKGACLPLLGITKDLETHNKRQIRAYENNEEFHEEFNWEAAIKKEMPNLIASTQRFCLTSFIRKGYDLFLILNFSPKFVDHLCKDVTKSAIRKINRMGRLGASVRMLKTAFVGNILNYLSSLTYDVLQSSVNFLRSKDKRKKVDVRAAAKWVYKRCLYYSVLLASSTVGYSIGTLVGDKGQIVSVILALVTETMGTELYNKYLN